jgi:hypothetical protein
MVFFCSFLLNECGPPHPLAPADFLSTQAQSWRRSLLGALPENKRKDLKRWNQSGVRNSVSQNPEYVFSILPTLKSGFP